MGGAAAHQGRRRALRPRCFRGTSGSNTALQLWLKGNIVARQPETWLAGTIRILARRGDMASSPRQTFNGEQHEPRGAPVWIADGDALWVPATVENRKEAEDGSVEFEVRCVGGDLRRVTQTADDRPLLPRNVFKDSRGVLDVHDLIARPPASRPRLRATKLAYNRPSRTSTSRRSWRP